MQALPLIKDLRRRLRNEIILFPICGELQNAERVLGIYEELVIQMGLEEKQLDENVSVAFDALIDIARQPFIAAAAHGVRGAAGGR